MSGILIDICIYVLCGVLTAFVIKKTLVRNLENFEVVITALFWPFFATLAIIVSIIKLFYE